MQGKSESAGVWQCSERKMEPADDTKISVSDKSSFDDVTLPYVRFLRSLGLLAFEGRDLKFFGTRVLLIYFSISSIIHWTMYVFFCMNSKELQVDTIAETVIVIGEQVRYYMLILARDNLGYMMRECARLWSMCSHDGHKCVRSHERKLRKLFKLFVASCCLINVLYPVNALITRLPPLQPNDTQRRVLPYKWYVDNNDNVWPGYWYIFVLEMIVVQNTIVVGSICDAILPLFMILGAGYFRHLSELLLQPDYSEQFVRRCITFHQRILTYCARLNKFARMMLLTQLLSTGYNISLILLKLVSSDRDKYKYLSILSVNLCQLLLVQWSPDFLFDESLAVANAAYFASVEWMQHRFGKHLLIIITRAQRPVQITAGGFVNLSLQSFGSMLTSAFSFFTVLRNLKL